MRKLSRRETVLELLRTYQDVVCPLNSAGDWIGGGPGSRMHVRDPQHPYFKGSYRTLEEILLHMRSLPTLAREYWAVSEAFIRCERRIVERQVRRKAKNNRTVTVTVRLSEPVRVRPVSQVDVDAGVDWITGEFDRRGVSPFLPLEVLEVAA